MNERSVPPWPEEFAARYRDAGFWRDQSLGHRLWRAAEQRPESIAVVDERRRVTYQEITERADSLAEKLLELGAARGDNVVVQLPNSWEFVLVVLACLRAGVAPVLALASHREHEIEYLVRLTRARLVVVADYWRGFDHQEMASRVAGAVEQDCDVVVAGEPRSRNLGLYALSRNDGQTGVRKRSMDSRATGADETALYLLSGGTTGRPKLIARTHNDYEYSFRRMGEIIGVGADTRYLVALPAAHNFPLGGPGILGTLTAGGRVVMLPSPEPGAAQAAVEKESPDVVSLVPAVARRWTDHIEAAAMDPGSFRIVQIGGAVLEPDLAERVRTVFDCRLQQVFGMAEGLLNCTRLDDPDEVVLNTQGRPISAGDEVLITDDDGAPAPFGAVGELLARGPYTPRGYYRAPEHNARRFTAEGWYRTGDLVRWHPSGNLVVVGRTKDVINRGGEKISADEVESLARECLRVADAAAVPLSAQEIGERVCLVLVPEANGTTPGLDEVRSEFIARGVARYKIPERVETMEKLPLTPIGKVDKAKLRRVLESSGGDG
ncbi:2,3-dihydroxybenzoate-AMP ligase [Actinopolyspora mzabensis]|uniref:2,3-dihydroxybenzoate-AMP ligase n=1 Tax=Actinopolyspora mzabensis TaxID=995066 RepID=A0A1G8Y440_ACTMZ|nr:AMP-binding protein [Actinopolyspora mzabensis]SDJ97608.1 2,3-dihydroxybenzoate-AMP ligase [Actinopolyspora mzabensis]